MFTTTYPETVKDGDVHQVIEKVQWADGKQDGTPCVFIKLRKAEVFRCTECGMHGVAGYTFTEKGRCRKGSKCGCR